MIIQEPSVGGVPDLQVRCDPEHQQHRGDDGHRDGGDAA